MLYSLDDLTNPIREIPHRREYFIWRNRLTEDEYETLVATLSAKLDGGRILTSSFIPGKDWTDTPYQIIYEKACAEDVQHAAFFFGLIMWDAVMRHPDRWTFIKSESVQGTTYFRVEQNNG